MRPIKLELEGFTVYRKKTLIDFSNLDFFVIVGRTGSGKTSIIDAMCYALYGRVPRHTKQNVHEKVLSEGSKRLHVSFEFSVKNKIYTIKRSYLKNGKSEVRFFQDGKPLNLSAKEVEKKVVDILGMDYDTFTRVIVLPQGQFDRFLKPQEAKERREILNKLLGYDKLFEAISRQLKEKYENIRQILDSVEKDLSKCSDYTPEALQSHMSEKEQLQKDIKDLEEKINTIKQRKVEFDILYRHYQDLQQKQREYDELKSKEEFYKKEKEKLKLAKQALEYKPIWESYKEIEEKLEKKEEEKNKIYKEHERLNLKLQEIRPQLDDLEKKHSQMPNKRQRFSYLSALVERLKVLLDKQHKLASLNKEIEGLNVKEELESNQLTNLESRVKRGEEETSKVEDEILILEEQLKMLEGFVSLKEHAEEINQIENQIRNISKNIESLQKTAEEISNRKSIKQQELLRAHTIQIRQNLKVGDQCPVCGSIIESLPHISEYLDFKEVEKEIKEIEKIEKETLAQIEREKGRLDTLQNRFLDIHKKLGSYEPYQIIQKYEEFKETQTKIEHLKKRLKLYREKLEELKEERNKVWQNLTKIQTEKKEKEKQRNETYSQLQEGKRELGSSLGVDAESIDLKFYLETAIKEKDQLDKEISEIEKNYNEIKDKANNLEKEKHAKEEIYKKILADIEQLKKEKSEKAPAVYEIIKKYGTIENFEALLIDKNELEKLESEIAEYERQLHFLEGTVKDLKEKVKDFVLDEYNNLVEQLRLLEDSYKEKEKEVWEKNKQIEEIQKGIKRKEELEVKKIELEKNKNAYEILKKDFESNRFPDYVSKSMLDVIAQRANIYLVELSNGLYRFVLKEGNLLVYDTSIDAERDISTLSGGETFLASLALAFGVAEVLSHGATIESIFIDEGFGSLDRETRENLGEFFELIKRNAQKMVGIISHLDDLKEKFDQRIEVYKEGDFASLRVIDLYGGADGT